MSLLKKVKNKEVHPYYGVKVQKAGESFEKIKDYTIVGAQVYYTSLNNMQNSLDVLSYRFFLIDGNVEKKISDNFYVLESNNKLVDNENYFNDIKMMRGVNINNFIGVKLQDVFVKTDVVTRAENLECVLEKSLFAEGLPTREEALCAFKCRKQMKENVNEGFSIKYSQLPLLSKSNVKKEYIEDMKILDIVEYAKKWGNGKCIADIITKGKNKE